MKVKELETRLRDIVAQEIPLPGGGRTAERHRVLAAAGCEDLTLAKLAEAHWDAVAILAEAGRRAVPGMLYAVWASEISGKGLRMEETAAGPVVSGSKPFCSGLGLADRALITVAWPEARLVEVDLRSDPERLEVDLSAWQTDAFRQTQTGSITFREMPVPREGLVGWAGWYLERAGFWHGACGPAACWAGGVAGLLEFALRSKRDDPHTMAHLGAMKASVWAMQAMLDQAGREIDAEPLAVEAAQVRALQLRHMIEQMGSDMLRRFARAYGPQPLAMESEVSRRYKEADLYLRQSHGERDLEALGRLVRRTGGSS